MSNARAGIGVDYKYADRYPAGLTGLVRTWQNRLSHLSVVGVDAPDDGAVLRANVGSLPIIHHLSNVSPGDPDGPHLDRLEKLDIITRAMSAVWCGEDIGIWSVGSFAIPYFAPSPLTDDVAQMIGERIVSVMNGSSVPFLAEVPSCSFTVGRLSLGEFFHRIVRISGCGIVLDVSHVLSYALSTGRRPADVLDSLPLDAVVEVHVAGGRINKSYPFRYIDSHSDPVMDDVLDLLGHAVERCAGLRAVTYEIGMQLTAQMLAHDFERIEVVLAQLGFEPRLIGPGKAELRT